MNAPLPKVTDDWCELCHAPPFFELPLAERLLSWACYRLALVWPHFMFMWKLHAAILPWAGNVAFRCHCRRAA